jgi:uncharacterized membrane protein YadS
MSAGILDVIIRVGIFVATSFLFGIVLMAYLRLKNRKMLLISVGFGIFFAHALVTLPELVSDAYQVVMSENVHLFIHMVALIFILIGILKD